MNASRCKRRITFCCVGWMILIWNHVFACNISILVFGFEICDVYKKPMIYRKPHYHSVTSSLYELYQSVFIFVQNLSTSTDCQNEPFSYEYDIYSLWMECIFLEVIVKSFLCNKDHSCAPKLDTTFTNYYYRLCITIFFILYSSHCHSYFMCTNIKSKHTNKHLRLWKFRFADSQK